MKKKIASVIVHSRRILIAFLIGIVGALTLPDIRWRPDDPPYSVEPVKPSHRSSMQPILELWKDSPDGTAFCGKVKTLPGCWDVSDNFTPGSVISGIVRTKRSEALLVTILPPISPKAQKENDEYRRLPIIVYHVPRSPGVFIIDPEGNTRSIEKNSGYRLQSEALERLASN